MSPGTRPTLAGVFLSSFAVIPQVKSALSPKAVACGRPPSGEAWIAFCCAFPAFLLRESKMRGSITKTNLGSPICSYPSDVRLSIVTY